MTLLTLSREAPTSAARSLCVSFISIRTPSGVAHAVRLGQLQQLLGDAAMHIEKEQVFDHRVRLAQTLGKRRQKLERHARAAHDDVHEVLPLDGVRLDRLDGHRAGGARLAIEQRQLAKGVARAE